jgi:hypothetical protein
LIHLISHYNSKGGVKHQLLLHQKKICGVS